MARRTTEGAKFIENFGANRFFQLKAFVAAFGADFDNVLKAVNTLNSKELSELRRISRACGSARYRLKPQEVALLERLGSSFGSVAAPARTVGSGLAAILTRADRLPNQTELSNWLEHINYQGGAPSEARESLLADGIGA
ncbi:MAG: hypothetical protein OXU45_03345 [Candidatus Melainabacteria bacterium]|nr:hypothetical protein [Candidatus Melainabacteria bacterium]